MARFKPGDKAFIVVSNIYVHEVEVLRYSGGFVTIHIIGDYTHGRGRINLRESRLFATKEEAAASIKRQTVFL